MSTYQKYLAGYARGYIGFNTIAVLFQSCWGSIAAMVILQNGTSLPQFIQLFFTVILCMAFNAAVLSQQKLKIVFNLLIASVGINGLFLILNTLFIG
ncbi:hypothetical protein AM493_01335 [Flavobacterium akiainvivens]|uniref:Uncharacterized protein n=1 Tax=Flavobacterium akiainvivens TaxID=1202724 RepID=A0A0M9VGT8_9FLAO|nr:hypothetical protein [Flavobacterium akiainvivens]KOS04836.1 hypothetical protein AM493_01335 [Flavobacterium akiainvivens]SFQ43475.1 hypothetical protein SAMN05444144_104256 [Flavobacterium akiainvivens]